MVLYPSSAREGVINLTSQAGAQGPDFEQSEVILLQAHTFSAHLFGLISWLHFLTVRLPQGQRRGCLLCLPGPSTRHVPAHSAKDSELTLGMPHSKASPRSRLWYPPSLTIDSLHHDFPRAEHRPRWSGGKSGGVGGSPYIPGIPTQISTAETRSVTQRDGQPVNHFPDLYSK